VWIGVTGSAAAPRPAGTGRRAEHPADMAEDYEADADDWNERELAER
jgi:hypothetical protein